MDQIGRSISATCAPTKAENPDDTHDHEIRDQPDTENRSNSPNLSPIDTPALILRDTQLNLSAEPSDNSSGSDTENTGEPEGTSHLETGPDPGPEPDLELYTEISRDQDSNDPISTRSTSSESLRSMRDTAEEITSEPTPAVAPTGEKKRGEPFPGNYPKWKPIWLRRAILWAFAFVFGGCAVALLVLERLSSSQHGFFVSASTIHYAWTYGPTAFLTIIAALWRQVDISVKSASPWKCLQNKDIDNPALLNALTDEYLSLMPPQVLIKSIRRRNWQIIIASSAQLLLQAAVSTLVNLESKNSH